MFFDYKIYLRIIISEWLRTECSYQISGAGILIEIHMCYADCILRISFQYDYFGMVSDLLEKQFADRGIRLIPPILGTRYFEKELLYGSNEDVEVVIGDGPWSENHPPG